MSDLEWIDRCAMRIGEIDSSMPHEQTIAEARSLWGPEQAMHPVAAAEAHFGHLVKSRSLLHRMVLDMGGSREVD